MGHVLELGLVTAVAPDAYLASNAWNWGIYYVDLVKSVRDGAANLSVPWEI